MSVIVDCRSRPVHRSNPLEECVMVAFVSVVDDDESVRESLPDLLGELGFTTSAFASAEEFLVSDCIRNTQCLILDIAMPGMSGPELHRELILRGHSIPTIFITGQSDRRVRPGLLRQGAVECLFKPFTDQDLRAVLDAALDGNRRRNDVLVERE